jgi:hypothetical protein
MFKGPWAPHKLLILLAPRDGVREPNDINQLDCQTALENGFGPQRLFGALANRKALANQVKPTSRRWCAHSSSGEVEGRGS